MVPSISIPSRGDIKKYRAFFSRINAVVVSRASVMQYLLEYNNYVQAKAGQWLANLIDVHQPEGPQQQRTVLPQLDSVEALLHAIERKLQVQIKDYVGAGDHAAAFVTDRGTVVKISDDDQEAALWHKLRRQKLPGLIQSYGVWRLASRRVGSYDVYLIHVEYAPEPIDSGLAALIDDITELATRRTSRENRKNLQTKWLTWSRSQQEQAARNVAAHHYIEAFKHGAREDHRLLPIVRFLIVLFHEYGTHLPDFQEGNFRIDKNGNVVIVDPSVPIFRGPVASPPEFVFENRLASALNSYNLPRLFID